MVASVPQGHREAATRTQLVVPPAPQALEASRERRRRVAFIVLVFLCDGGAAAQADIASADGALVDIRLVGVFVESSDEGVAFPRILERFNTRCCLVFVFISGSGTLLAPEIMDLNLPQPLPDRLNSTSSLLLLVLHQMPTINPQIQRCLPLLLAQFPPLHQLRVEHVLEVLRLEHDAAPERGLELVG